MSRVKAPPQTSKTCGTCEIEKDASAFYVGSGGRLRGRCKACYSIYNAEQNIKHVAKRKEYYASRGSGWDRGGRAKWDLTESERWAAYIKRVYKIPIEVAEQMFAIQQGYCAICRGHCNRSNSGRLCIDHDHNSGAVRGLLCFQCNIGLGKFKDDPAVVSRAAAYLEAA